MPQRQKKSIIFGSGEGGWLNVSLHYKKVIKRFYILILLFLTSVLTVFGQYGKIKGQVYDKREQKLLTYANIWLVDTKKGTTSDIYGNFNIDSIPVGTYSLKVAFYGYEEKTLTEIKINRDTILTIKLELAPLCEYDEHSKNKTCPICGKRDKVVPIEYGLPIGEIDKKNKHVYYGGCKITNCDPNWYCKRDKYKF